MPRIMGNRIVRLLVLGALTTVTLLATAGPASACSCLIPDAEALFANADGAFVGTLVQAPSQPITGVVSSADPVPWVFEVQAAYKGDISSPITVTSPLSSASCGLEMVEGDRASLFVYRDGDGWRGDLCSTMGPEALAAGPFVEVAFSRDSQSGSSEARWALGIVAAVGAGAVGAYWVRSRRGSAPT